MTIAYLYGLRLGFPLVYLGKVLGCLSAFAIGRSCLRDCCERHVRKTRLLRAVEGAVAKALSERRESRPRGGRRSRHSRGCESRSRFGSPFCRAPPTSPSRSKTTAGM